MEIKRRKADMKDLPFSDVNERSDFFILVTFLNLFSVLFLSLPQIREYYAKRH